ncbi:hypothetical protein [Streptococcus merionis]|uniref:Lipoprotein n=1 Tax=Streptococcus merionis TaxID=400065 RepID=A0A239SPJ7_9STRE|nr:hypothetical protein [Streptococcus merionis]SNU87330.1 Uncharacterised protein [Streptococcus merionis]
MKKKLLSILALGLTILLVACGQRNNLTTDDFPSIGSGLTKSSLEQAVGKPHESSKSPLDVAKMMLQIFDASKEVDPKWNPENTPTEYYLYKLSDGNTAMVAILVDDQVVEITTNPLRYEE